MPPHLHPRSRLTSSLFATTLFASFFVVALPHALPCPAPRVAYADENGEIQPNGRRRRRRREFVGKEREDVVQEKTLADATGLVKSTQNGEIEEKERDYSDETPRRSKIKRECPVPKPGGLVGEMLGFRKARAIEETAGDGRKPP